MTDAIQTPSAATQTPANRPRLGRCATAFGHLWHGQLFRTQNPDANCPTRAHPGPGAREPTRPLTASGPIRTPEDTPAHTCYADDSEFGRCIVILARAYS
jgi:hypothetical protein